MVDLASNGLETSGCDGTWSRLEPADRFVRMIDHFARVASNLEAPRFDGRDAPTNPLTQMQVLDAFLRNEN